MVIQSNHRRDDRSLIIRRRVHDTLSYKEFLILPKNLQQNLSGILFAQVGNQRVQMAAMLCSLSLQLQTLALFPVKLIAGRQGGRGKKKLDADSLVRFGYVAGSIIRRRAYRVPGGLLRRRETISSFCRSEMDQASGKSVSATTCGKGDANDAKEAELLHSFYAIPSIDKAWTSSSRKGNGGIDVVVAMSQLNLPANAKRTFMSTVYIPDPSANMSDYHWSPFPFELSGASLIVPSPSGTKLLVVRKSDVESKDGASSVKLEIWGPGQLLKDIYVPASKHGSIYADGWFEGVSWSQDESFIAYVAEEPANTRPVYGQSVSSCAGQSSSDSLESGSWRGQGDWLEDWGESYSGKRRPVLFVVNIARLEALKKDFMKKLSYASLVLSGAVQIVEGIPKDISAGQVVWAPHLDMPPSDTGGKQLLVFVGWSSFAGNFSTPRKLGMKYCYNRPCSLYYVEAPVPGSETSKPAAVATKLTADISSAISPRFSPDGKLLVFLSSQAAVNTGAHSATNSLHSIDWPANGSLGPHMQIRDVVPVVQRAEEGGFPGLYCSNLISNPWLPDNCTLLLSSAWRSQQVILGVNILSGDVMRVSPADSQASWNLLGLQNRCTIAVVSSPTKPHSLKLGHLIPPSTPVKTGKEWSWFNISVPSLKYAEKVETSMSSMQFEVLQIPVPVTETHKNLSEGAKQPFEAIFVSPKASNNKPSAGETKSLDDIPPLVLVLHGGPHAVTQTSFSRTAAFLSALGFNLLHVNYRGSLGFGEEALQSLPGNVGHQDVGDVLTALDHVIENGLANPAKVAVIGGSHGGFLTSHLIGQAPDRFTTGVLRNPVCNVSSMVGITDIPDWCYVEAFGKGGLNSYSEAPSAQDLNVLYRCSPISHLSKVKVPTLFLLGAQDRRVPVSNGFQYVQALRASGLEVKVILFPEDVHAIDRPQSEFEAFLNTGTWLKRFLQ